MAYTILGYGKETAKFSGSYSMEAAREALRRALVRDGRFRATLGQVEFSPRTKTMPDGWAFEVRYVRLVTAKEYCGQHPGPCEANPLLGPRKKPRATYLEWQDWIAFNTLVNDVLDRFDFEADVWSTPAEALSFGRKMWIRKDNRRRVLWDWEEVARLSDGRAIRVWNAGSDNQFIERASGVVRVGLTAGQRLLVGTPEEREAEAKRQGVFETWETKARRDRNSRVEGGR